MRRLVLTGATRGLGLEICRRLLLQGDQVVTCGREFSAELNRLKSMFGTRLEFHRIDFSSTNAVKQFGIEANLAAGVDGFVANAGIGTEGLLALTPTAAIEQSLQVNLVAPILLTREIIKGMLPKGGSIVFISSVAARTGFAGLSVYAAAKGGLLAFSRVIAREYGRRGIRSNCLLPGFLETNMTRGLPMDHRSRLRNRTALRRLGQVTDVAGAVLFLLSQEAAYVTGMEMVVDGGMIA
jgi:3-oxoacyl-[acyl-carrier protein] reductase